MEQEEDDATPGETTFAVREGEVVVGDSVWRTRTGKRTHLFNSCRSIIKAYKGEDLIEELISIEIIDENDTVTDNISKRKVYTRGQRRIEFFEMLQKRELLLTDRILSDTSCIGGERPTADEVRAITSYLSNNVVNFRPPHMSLPMLRRLLLRCSIRSVSPEQVATGRYVYVRGVPASFCCLVLHGRLQIRAGNEGFTTEIGAWTTLAMQALTDAECVTAPLSIPP